MIQVTRMPHGKDLHCLVIVDEDTLFVGGGYPNFKEAFLYTKSTEYKTIF